MATHHLSKLQKIHVNAIRKDGRDAVRQCPDDDPMRCAFSRYRLVPDGHHGHLHQWISDHRSRADAEQGVNEIDIDSPEERRRRWLERRTKRKM